MTKQFEQLTFMIMQNKLEPVEKNNNNNKKPPFIKHFLNSLILKRKVLITALRLAKHNLEKGPKNVQNVFGNPQECLGL